MAGNTRFPGGITADIIGDVTGDVAGGVKHTQTVESANGAITIPTHSQTIVITKGTAAALTLADPTATTHDGVRLTIVSTTDAAHTIDNSAGSGFNGGGAGEDVATFAANAGSCLIVEAYQGVWYTVGNIGATLA